MKPASSMLALAAIALAVLIGGARPDSALAQGAADKISPDRIRAATGKVDDAGIRANTRTSRDLRPKN